MSIFNGIVCRNSDKAFENAIENGLKNPEDYMYMYTKENTDYFKHVDTRRYTAFEYIEENTYNNQLTK